MALKTMIIPVWTPISGLIWWYSFYKKYSWRCRWTITTWNIPQSQYGTSTWIPPATRQKTKPTLAQGFLSRDITSRTNANLLQSNQSHRKFVRNKNTSTLHFIRTPLKKQSTKACTTFGMNIPMLASFTHGILYWHLCGCAWDIKY